MHWLRALVLVLSVSLAWAAPAWAVGTQFTGDCNTISWVADTDADLAGYRLYDRTSTSNPYTLFATVGAQIASLPCSQFNFNPGQHYFSMTAFDTSGNESAHSSEIPFFIVALSTNQVSNLNVTIVNTTDMTLSWTEVDGGNGLPAGYDIRMASPTISWNSAASVTSGTCTTPVAGTTIGATKTCTVTGLTNGTAYQFQLIPFSGTYGVNAQFGPLSNITGATTGGTPPPVITRATMFVDDFNRADENPLSKAGTWDAGYFDDSRATVLSSLQVVSNAAREVTISGEHAYMNTVNATGAVFPNNQWASMTIKTTTAADYVYGWLLLHEADPPTWSGYEGGMTTSATDPNTTWIVRRDAGVKVNLAADTTQTWVAGDVLLFECVFNSVTLTNDLTVSRNGTVIVTAHDATYPGGRPGMATYLSNTRAVADLELDNFAAGNYTTAPTTQPCDCDSH